METIALGECKACRISGHTLLLPWVSKYSDMTISYGVKNECFFVHKIVVCSQSAVILKALDSQFSKGSTANFDLPEYDKQVIEATLEYMYGQDYTIGSKGIEIPKHIDWPLLKIASLKISEPADGASKRVKEVLFHASVSCLAAYLEIPTLSSLANEKMENVIKNQWHLIESFFPGIVKIIYDMDSHDSLHRILIEACARNVQSLFKREDFKQLDESKEATYKIREFSADVVAKAIDFMYTGDYLYQDASEANNIDGDTQEPPKKKRRRRKHRKPEAYGEGTSETVDADKENRDPQEGLELLLHGKVNCLGDYLNIPALCELAIHKIDTLLKESWDGARSQFPQFLDLVCESAGDKNLHSTAARLTVKHLDDLVKDNIFEASRLPPCFFANVFQSVRDEIQGLKADAERSRDEKRELEGRLRKVDDLVAYSRKQRNPGRPPRSSEKYVPSTDITSNKIFCFIQHHGFDIFD
ncbi:hypothetical protein KEM56_003905 [Ascosphaera pollenicola]|nr:hypothetical protein KEM56_003905 [Ascosphaera pollenicola]